MNYAVVASEHVDPNVIDYCTTEQILCVHGDKFSYPTAKVQIKLGRWKQLCKVVVAPNLPVAVLLGTDLYHPTESLHTGPMVTTQAQKQKQDMLLDTTTSDIQPSNQKVDQPFTENEANIPSNGASTTIKSRKDDDQQASLNATPDQLKR